MWALNITSATNLNVGYPPLADLCLHLELVLLMLVDAFLGDSCLGDSPLAGCLARLRHRPQDNLMGAGLALIDILQTSCCDEGAVVVV